MTPYTKKIVELHKIHKAIENCGCNKDEQGGGDENSGTLLMSLIPDNFPKPDLFLFYRDSIDDNPIDVTNYNITDLLELTEREGTSHSHIDCLYENSNLNSPIIKLIKVIFYGGLFSIHVENIYKGNVLNTMVLYNNKSYYVYYIELS